MSKRKSQHEERNMKEAEDGVVVVKDNPNDDDKNTTTTPKRSLRSRNVAIYVLKKSAHPPPSSTPTTSLLPTATTIQKQIKKTNVEGGVGLHLLASVSHVQAPVSTLVKNEKLKGLMDKNLAMNKDTKNSDSTFKPEILEGSICSLNTSTDSTLIASPIPNQINKIQLISLEETPSILKRHDTKSLTISVQKPIPDSNPVSHSRKRKQTIDIRKEEQFIPLLKPSPEKKIKKAKSKKTTKKVLKKSKIIEKTVITTNDPVECSVTHDHDYPIIPQHDNNNENEPNKENVQLEITTNTSINNDNDNSHYCLKDGDSIKVKCEKCSATFFSLKNFLIHLKKFKNQERIHGQKHHHHHQQQQGDETELKQNVNSNSTDLIESNPSNPIQNITEEDDESPFAELLSLDDDNDDVIIESGSEDDSDDTSILDTDHSPSKFTNVRKVRLGNKLYKWNTSRNIKVEKIPVIPNLNHEISKHDSIPCSCGHMYKGYYNLAHHCKKTGHEIPVQYQTRFFCSICTASDTTTQPLETKGTDEEQEGKDGDGVQEQQEGKVKEQDEQEQEKDLSDTSTPPITSELILPGVVGFKTKAELTKHMKEEHLGEKIIKCTSCAATFWYQNELQSHLLVHHKIFQKFECQTCLNEGKSVSFTLLSHLHRHGRNYHTTKVQKRAPGKKFIPMLCPVCFPSESNEIQENDGKEISHYQEIDSNSITLNSDFEKHPDQQQVEQKVEIIIEDFHFDSTLNLNTIENSEQQQLQQVEVIIDDSPCAYTLNPPEKIIYTTKRQLIEHMKIEHPNGPKLLKCTYPECPRDFYHTNSLRNHISLIHRPESDLPHQCEFEGCNKKFAYPNMLMEHIKNHTGEKPFSCEVCSRRFKSRHGFNAHKRSHVEEFLCNYCSKTFNIQYNLKRHIDAVHLGRKDFHCSFCELSFHQKVSLQAHEALKHTKERNHACTILDCTESFFSASDLSRHRRIDHCVPALYSRRKIPINEGEGQEKVQKSKKKKPIQCTECGIISHGTTTHMNHMYNTHGIGSKDYLCNNCGKTFLTLYFLNVHVRRTHNEDQQKKVKERQRLMGQIRKAKVKKSHEKMTYKCISCPEKTFSSASGLTRHLKIHNRDSVLTCPHSGCKWTFTSDYRLDRHCVTHHNDESTFPKRRRMNASENGDLNSNEQQQQHERDEEAVRILQQESIVIYAGNDVEEEEEEDGHDVEDDEEDGEEEEDDQF